MSDRVYLNGAYLPISEAKVSVMDRGFLFGDGVYEVIPAYHGKLFRFEDHIVRLDASLAGIRLQCHKTLDEWRDILQTLLEGGKDEYVYLQITRGAAPKRDHGFPENVEPTVFAMAAEIKPFAGRITGIKAATMEDTRWLRCNIKATALLAHLLLRQEALDQDCAEAILLKNGYITEGAASNVFAVIDEELITPPKTSDILAGITRDVILELAATNGIAHREDIIALEGLQSASEIWVASSTREIVPVVELDGMPVGNGQPGPLFQRMDALFQAYKQSLA